MGCWRCTSACSYCPRLCRNEQQTLLVLVHRTGVSGGANWQHGRDKNRRKPMKIIIAPDSFKDSLSAEGVAQAIAAGLAQVWPDAHVVQCPMADGGEGTVESVLAACQ